MATRSSAQPNWGTNWWLQRSAGRKDSTNIPVRGTWPDVIVPQLRTLLTETNHVVLTLDPPLIHLRIAPRAP